MFFIFSIVGFLLGGLIGVGVTSAFFPAAWIGLAVGIVLWFLVKIIGAEGASSLGGAADIGFDLFD